MFARQVILFDYECLVKVKEVSLKDQIPHASQDLVIWNKR